MKFALIVVGIVGFAGLTVVVAFVLGLRYESRLVRRFGRWFTRSVVNSRQMKTAGTPGAYASVIRHRGRRTGRAYENPVQAVPVDDGFVIALPYGAATNWVRNVMSNGSATIANDGRTYTVDRPELIPIDDVAMLFPPADIRLHRLFGVDECLRVRRRAPAEASTTTTARDLTATPA